MAVKGMKLSSRVYFWEFLRFLPPLRKAREGCSLFDKRDNGFVEHVKGTSLIAPTIRGHSGLRYRDGRVSKVYLLALFFEHEKWLCNIKN